MQQLSIFDFVSEYWVGQEVVIWFDGWKTAKVLEIDSFNPSKILVEFIDGNDVWRALYRDWQLRDLQGMYQKSCGVMQ